jgi:hypothetical protein
LELKAANRAPIATSVSPYDDMILPNLINPVDRVLLKRPNWNPGFLSTD